MPDLRDPWLMPLRYRLFGTVFVKLDYFDGLVFVRKVRWYGGEPHICSHGWQIGEARLLPDGGCSGNICINHWSPFVPPNFGHKTKQAGIHIVSKSPDVA